MGKEAQNIFPISEDIKSRWSPRSFQEKTVEWSKIQSLFEATRWAASAFNEQPWRFIIGTKGDKTYDDIFSCLADGNKTWAGNAPILLLTVAKEFFTQNNKPNKHAFHDLGLAMGNMTSQASALDLYLHHMAGFSSEEAKRKFQIPDNFTPVTVVAIGYLGSPHKLPDNLQESELKKRERKHFSEFLFEEKWGTPAKDFLK